MRIASWNLNHRVGMTRFRSEAADAAIALDVDAIFFNEYFPKEHGTAFARRLTDGGWQHHLIPDEPPERANRTFVTSRVPVDIDSIALPTFDHQLPANLLVVRFPGVGLRVIALRVPAYEAHQRDLTLKSWDWLELAARALVDDAAVIVGDLNISPSSVRAGGDHFRRIRNAGWSLATPEAEPSYFSATGHTSTLDHLLHTKGVRVSGAAFVTKTGGYTLAGSSGALSDHAAIVAELQA
jgi:endonuclease/exonuclease/phosphatase family metal-dependent hydrolase